MLRHFASVFQPRIFVETGTFFGETTAAVADLFQRCYTIELSPELNTRAQRRFSNSPHITCIQGDSRVELPRVLHEIDEPALFWLDAHGSGGATADPGWDPLLQELDSIFHHPVKKHVILVDDASGRDEIMRGMPSHYRASVRNDIMRIVPT